jgi:hypothetical protein
MQKYITKVKQSKSKCKDPAFFYSSIIPCLLELISLDVVACGKTDVQKQIFVCRKSSQPSETQQLGTILSTDDVYVFLVAHNITSNYYPPPPPNKKNKIKECSL